MSASSGTNVLLSFIISICRNAVSPLQTQHFPRTETYVYTPLSSLALNTMHFTLQSLIAFVSEGVEAAAAKSLQSCPTLCDPIDSSPPGSSVHGIFQARVLEWGAIAFSKPDPN